MDENPIVQEPIRREVRRLLLERLLSGELPPGSRINETKISEQIGVSRTPLREALLQLEFEGFVDATKGKGFSVAALEADTARELYSLVGLLEGLALEEAGEVAESQLARLDELEAARALAKREHRLEQAVELDTEWHDVLVNGCRNRELRRILAVLKKRLFRYEYVLADLFHTRDGGQRIHHRQILDALRSGDHALGIQLLKDHWQAGAETRSRWLRERDAPDEKDKWTSLW